MEKKFKRILIEGAGLVGPVNAALFASVAEEVIVIEKRTRSDCERTYGRSVNLALGTKGWNMMRKLGFQDEVQKIIVPMKGRMIHFTDCTKRLEQSYGFYPNGKEQTLDAISRLGFSQLLVKLAEKNSNVEFRFGVSCTDVDCQTMVISLSNGETLNANDFDLVIGSDGINSQIRQSLQRHGLIKAEKTNLNYAYIEIEQPAVNGDYAIPANYLHIWPKGGGQMFASLPNPGGTLTGAMYAPIKGENSFCNINRLGDENFFRANFPSLVTLVPDFIEQYRSKKPSQLAEIRCDNWYHKNIVIVGDAAHAVTPFLGQGMNFSLYMAGILFDLLMQYPVEEAFKKYECYKTEAKLLADWSRKNFDEMSTTDSPELQLRKQIEAELEVREPLFASFHSKVCFRETPYLEIEAQLFPEDLIFQKVLELPNVYADWQTKLWPTIVQLMVRKGQVAGV